MCESLVKMEVRKNMLGSKSRGRLSLFLTVLAVSLASNMASAESAEKINEHKLLKAGWLENVVLEPWSLKLRAKLDTGAKTSSLHAINIERFKRNDEQWVRFQTIDPDEKTPLPPIETPLIRDVKIKRHKEKAQLRPVVEMTFCLDGQVYQSEFSLIDRGRFNYQVLLGRRMLQQGIIVDPATTFSLKTTRKGCKKLLSALNEQLKEQPAEE